MAVVSVLVQVRDQSDDVSLQQVFLLLRHLVRLRLAFVLTPVALEYKRGIWFNKHNRKRYHEALNNAVSKKYYAQRLYLYWTMRRRQSAVKEQSWLAE